MTKLVYLGLIHDKFILSPQHLTKSKCCTITPS